MDEIEFLDKIEGIKLKADEFHRGKEQGRIAEYHRIMGILIELEKKLLKEDKTGCTRDMIVEGAFTRIREAIYQEVV